MKLLKTAALGAALSLCALVAHAQTTFDFAYTFNPSLNGTNTESGELLSVTGSFTGTEIGSVISNISNVSVSVNGYAFNGPIVVEAWDNVAGNWSTSVTPTISLSDATQTNFIFADADAANAPGNITNLFTVSPATQAFVLDDNVQGASGPLTGTDTTTAHFTVTAVPEPSTYALMAAGLALVGLRLQRRRQA